MIAILSLLLWALFLKVENMRLEMEKIPNKVHALVEKEILDTMKEGFEYERATTKLVEQ